jgi:hypothetical protein
MANVEAFPLYQMNDIPNALRQLANKIEAGDRSAIRCVVVIETEDFETDYKAFGAEPFTPQHAAGLCFGASVMLMKEPTP